MLFPRTVSIKFLVVLFLTTTCTLTLGGLCVGEERVNSLIPDRRCVGGEGLIRNP